MPFDHILYVEDRAAAKAILASHRGTLIHELGHYTGANSMNAAAGHIVIADHGTRGAFIVHESHRAQLEADERRHKLTIAGACVLELYACNLTNVGRCRMDVDKHISLYDLINNADDEIRSIIMHEWKLDYMNFFEANRLSIRHNYDLCLQLIAERNYLIEGYHVIPTSRLTPPRQRNDVDRLREEELVDTDDARRIALRQFVGDVAVRPADAIESVHVEPAASVKLSLMSRVLKILGVD